MAVGPENSPRETAGFNPYGMGEKLIKEHADTMKKALLSGLFFLLAWLTPAAWAQTVSGNVAVTIQDESGTPVAKAVVTAVNTGTGVAHSAAANESGECLLRDLPPGAYDITVVAPGFTKSVQKNFPVQLSRTNAATFILQAATEKSTPQVKEAPPSLNMTSAQIEGTFEGRELAELPTATIGLGVVNLALLEAGVSSSGGVGSGVGPAVGGQRPTDNNYTIEGIDNNNKTATGPEARVPNDAVGQFTLLQNGFDTEFGNSNGGQYNQTIVSGTKKYHGMLYDYTQNRYLNATDQAAVVSGSNPQRPRYDFSRFGGQAGGPVPYFLKDKLFFFGNGEYDPLGQATIPAGGLCAPTPDGYTTLQSLLPGPNPNGSGSMVSPNANNLAVLQAYLPPAPADSTGTCPSTQGNPATGPIANPLYVCTGGWVNHGGLPCPGGTPVAVDVGLLSLVAPNYTNTYYLATGVDYNRSIRDQYRFRYIYNRSNSIDTQAQLPAFYLHQQVRDHLAAIDEYHIFGPNLTNELRLGYSRFSNITPSGNFRFTGLDKFPNLVFLDLNAQLGPDPNSPEFTVQNDYQISENLNWWHKNHNVRLGVEMRTFITPTTLTRNSRGDYQYSSLGTYLYDINPDIRAQRSNGSLNYYGNLVDSGLYVSDTWRLRPSLSFTYGIRYDFATVPLGEQNQSLNDSASVLGLLRWQEPRAPKNQLMPRFGFAWSPGGRRTWSIRGGAFMAYDVLYDNLGLNTIVAAAPQLGSTVDRSQATEALLGVPAGIVTQFLANGGIPPGTGAFNTFGPCPPPAGCGTAHTGATALADQQAATSGQIPVKLLNPLAITYTFGIQHLLRKNYTVELRFLGTHGYHLPLQVYLNRQSEVSSTSYLPTFLQTPSLGQLTALSTTLASIEATPLGSFVPGYVAGCAVVSGQTVDGLLPNSMGQLAPAPCFTSSITSFQPEGDSIYKGMAAQVTRHFEHGLQFTAAYTLSYAKDNSSSAFPNSVINPALPQDSQNLAADRANSAYDHRHRFTVAAYYEPPYFRTGSLWRRYLLANWFFVPVYTFQTGGWADLQSGVDSNLNGSSSGDRVLLNPSGTASTSATAIPTCVVGGVVIVGTGLSGGKTVNCTPGNTVAYTATNASARYIVAEPGALFPNNSLTVANRNTLRMPSINNLDVSVGKKIPIGERFRLEFYAQILNASNHPQYIAGSVNQINAINYTSSLYSSYVQPGTTQFNQPSMVFSSNPRVIQVGAKFTF
jgi:Carboxypeptidase regulatory-like domain